MGWLISQWVDLRDNLQETIDFPMEYGIIMDFPVIFPLNPSIEPPAMNVPHQPLDSSRKLERNSRRYERLRQEVTFGTVGPAGQQRGRLWTPWKRQKKW